MRHEHEGLRRPGGEQGGGKGEGGVKRWGGEGSEGGCVCKSQAGLAGEECKH